MFLILAGNLFLSLLLASLGFGIAKLFFSKKIAELQWEQASLFGLGFTVIYCSGLNLLIPLSPLTFAVWLLFPTGAIIFFGRRMWSFFFAFLREPSAKTYLICLSGLIVIGAYVGSLVPGNLDTGLYHGQTVRWAREYPVVPGLANLHLRLGFNSLWFLPETLFGFAELFKQPMPLANGAVFLITASVLLKGWTALSRAETKWTDSVKAVALPFYIYWAYPNLSSLSPDLPAMSLTFLAFVFVIEYLDSPNLWRPVSAFVCAVLAITFKLSAVPILLIGFFGLWILWKNGFRGTVLMLLLLAGCLSIVWIARYVILTGYLVFPDTRLDWFHFDWKVPKALADNEAQWVRSWARGGMAPSELGLSPWVWIPKWWQTQSVFTKAVYAFAGLGLLLTPFLAIRSEWRKRIRGSHWVVFSIGMVAISFWFWQAPDIRFAAGFLSFVMAFSWGPWFGALIKRLELRWVSILLPTILLLITLGTSAKVLYRSAHFEPSVLVRPEPWPEVKLHSDPLSDKTENFFPDKGDGLAWYAPLPNSPYSGANALRRGPVIQDGYKAKNKFEH